LERIESDFGIFGIEYGFWGVRRNLNDYLGIIGGGGWVLVIAKII